MHILSHRTLMLRVDKLERRSGFDTVEVMDGHMDDNPTALDRLIQRAVGSSIHFKAQAGLGNWGTYGFQYTYEAHLNT